MTSEHKLILFVTLSLLSCSSLPENKTTFTPNPTKYIFSCGTDSLRQAIITELFEYNGLNLYFEGSEFPEEVADIFSRPENKEDFYLYDEFSSSIGQSNTYPGLRYNASFHLHINSIDEGHTELIINTINPRVIIGKKLLPSFPHFARGDKYRDVEPSTVEEYEILFKIGQAINEDMPKVNYPDQTTDSLKDGKKE